MPLNKGQPNASTSVLHTKLDGFILISPQISGRAMGPKCVVLNLDEPEMWILWRQWGEICWTSSGWAEGYTICKESQSGPAHPAHRKSLAASDLAPSWLKTHLFIFYNTPIRQICLHLKQILLSEKTHTQHSVPVSRESRLRDIFFL